MLLNALLLGLSLPSSVFSNTPLANRNVPSNGWQKVTKRSWEEASELASSFVAKLTLKEKAAMVTGNIVAACDGNINPIPRLNFSGLCLHDGPAGIRIADLATLFPASVTTGATWDKELMYARGFAMGQEFRGKGAHIILGPVAGPIGRHPLGGRNWEGFGTDPYLDGIAVDATIRGHQDAGVQSCVKHFIGNEQETHRTRVVAYGRTIEAVSSNIDDRTLHELYLWPFANAIRAGTSSVMCSYNRLNLTYACEHDESLNKILKSELGFRGYVMSDWFATHSGVKSIEAGLDMNMPGVLDQTLASSASSIPYDEVPSFFGGNLTAAVNNGTLKESRVNDMVRRVMTPYFYLGQDKDYPRVDPSTIYMSYIANGIAVNTKRIPPATDVRGDHSALVREIAAAGTVLLKNEGGILPIRNVSNVAVFGNDAPDTTDGLYFTYTVANPTDRPYGAKYGTLPIGGGSGSGRTSDLVSPLRAIRERGVSDGFRTQYITNNDLLAGDNFTSIFPMPDICLVFLKTFSNEAWDRLAFENDWNSTLAVQNAAAFCPGKTVVITHSPGVNTLPWSSEVAAIVAAHYPGEQSGSSIVDVLWGDVNPSGHLTYTIPKQEKDYNFPVVNITGLKWFNSNLWQSNFTEGLLTDYRHFDSQGIEPLYEFGYGLSYTTFNISSSITINQLDKNLTALPRSNATVTPGGKPDLWNTVINITALVSNTGTVAGAAVPQLYVSLPSGNPGGSPGGSPVRVLRGFEKVHLSPSESATVAFPLMRRDVSFWSIEDQDWRIPQGNITLGLGFSSRDIRTSIDIKLL